MLSDWHFIVRIDIIDMHSACQNPGVEAHGKHLESFYIQTPEMAGQRGPQPKKIFFAGTQCALELFLLLAEQLLDRHFIDVKNLRLKKCLSYCYPKESQTKKQ